MQRQIYEDYFECWLMWKALDLKVYLGRPTYSERLRPTYSECLRPYTCRRFLMLKVNIEQWARVHRLQLYKCWRHVKSMMILEHLAISAIFFYFLLFPQSKLVFYKVNSTYRLYCHHLFQCHQSRVLIIHICCFW